MDDIIILYVAYELLVEKNKREKSKNVDPLLSIRLSEEAFSITF